MSAPQRTAILFPGQGSSVDGARVLVEKHCPELHERCVEALGSDPFERAAQSTRFAQPAIFLASIAGWRSMAGAGIEARAFAGHSVGELSALTAAGVLSTKDGLDLVMLRGRLMDDAATASGDGGMLAVLKGTLTDAEELARSFGLALANDNAVGQVVLSGPRTQLRDAALAARERGLRAIALDVAGAFHSPAMASAVEPFRNAVRRIALNPPSAPVFSGMTAQRFGDVPRELAQAVCSPVRWRQTMTALERFQIDSFVDVGPDEVLARLAQRNVPGAGALRLEELRVNA